MTPFDAPGKQAFENTVGKGEIACNNCRTKSCQLYVTMYFRPAPKNLSDCIITSCIRCIIFPNSLFVQASGPLKTVADCSSR